MARASAEQWAKRVKRWKDSGLSAREFAAETGINASTLSFWRWKLTAEKDGGTRSRTRTRRTRSGTAAPAKTKRALRAQPGPAAAMFVEMPVAAVAHAAATLEILVGDDVRVLVPAGFDETTVARVMRAVRAAR